MKIGLVHLIPSNAFTDELFNALQPAHNENVVVLFWLLFRLRSLLQLSINKIVFFSIIIQVRLRLIFDAFNNLYGFSYLLISLRANLQRKEKRIAAFVLCFMLKVDFVLCAFTVAEQINQFHIFIGLHVFIVKDG